jgi:DGQHR domain-containing protein
MVFATINKAQTKVNKSLVYDLYDLANSRSPYRTAHNIVRVLNDNEKSSLKDKIKMLGIAEDSTQETIAQATLVECIVEYISKKPLKDRDILKRGEEIILDNDKKLFFRKWFKENQDLLIARTLLNYFNAISKKWPTAWNSNTILIKSTGIIGFMKFLQSIVGDNELKDVISEANFAKILNSIDLNPERFTNDNYPSGGIGQNKLKRELIEKSGLK